MYINVRENYLKTDMSRVSFIVECREKLDGRNAGIDCVSVIEMPINTTYITTIQCMALYCVIGL